MESTKRPRIAVICISHESNTFMEKPTTLEDFQQGTLLRGEDVRKAYGDAHHELAGFFNTLEAANFEAVPVFMARATPSGMISEETVDTLWSIAEEELDKIGEIDGILAAPHGAAVDAKTGDMDGWWLTRLRQRYGPKIPIIATLDPHANVTPKMISATDASITYRSNPHLDRTARGNEAADLMVRTIRGEIEPTQAASLPLFVINIERQHTESEPCLSLQAEVEKIRQRDKVLSASLILGFPYADVPEMGSGFIVVTDNDPSLAQQYADELTEYLWKNKEDFRGVMISVDEAIDLAADSAKPVCLLDMGDNVGGGGPADSTIMLHALHNRADLRSFLTVFDIESVKQAEQASIGDRIRLQIGGKTDPIHGEPLDIEVTIRSFHDGKYHETEVRHGGNPNYNMGPAVVVETDSNITIMLTSRRHGSSSLQQLLSNGIDPLSYDVLIAKGVHAPVAAYAPVCPTLLRVNTPGITTADMNELSYHNRRKPLFPFED